MQPTPCDIHEYNSDEYQNCIRDIVFDMAQDEWIMLDPRFPNLKGVTPKRIDELLEQMEDMKDYTEDYLQHVMVYDRDDIVGMCYELGQQIEKKYPGKLHSSHSIFVTTPRGGYEVLSVFAYTNELEKEQIPSHIKGISEDDYEDSIMLIQDYEDNTRKIIYDSAVRKAKNIIKHYEDKNYPIIPDIWLPTYLEYPENKIETVFIIDDIIASGEQMKQAVPKLLKFFNEDKVSMIDKFVDVIPIVLAKREDWFDERHDYASVFEKTLYHTETVGKYEWDESRRIIKPGKFIETTESTKQKQKEMKLIYDKLITVRFPWGSPDGESDKILTTLYEGRRGFDRIERKQRRCVVEPEQCELK